MRERAASGYTAQKWFIRHGPMSGHEGMRKDVALVAALREALGDDYDIMIDCWQSLNLDHAVDFCSRIEEYSTALGRGMLHARPHRQPRGAKAKTRHAPSGAEHEYDRWEFLVFHSKDASYPRATSTVWCTERDLEDRGLRDRARPHRHGHSTRIGIHFSVAHCFFYALSGISGEVECVHAFPKKSAGRGRLHLASPPPGAEDLDSAKIDARRTCVSEVEGLQAHHGLAPGFAQPPARPQGEAEGGQAGYWPLWF